MEFNTWDIALFVLFIIILLYIYGVYKRNHFVRNDVKTTDTYPFAGHFMGALFKRKHIINVFSDIYNAFPDQKYVGIYAGTAPCIILRDLELMKLVGIKDFDHFQDRSSSLNENADPLLGKSLVNLQGTTWKNMRATLSPAFTSSKMRNMFTYVVECGELLTNYYVKKLQESNNIVKNVEVKEAFNRYATDVIASVAFGLKIDSLTDKDNKFFTLGRQTTAIGTWRLIRMLLITIFRRIAKFLGISLLGKEVSTFFRNLVNDQMKLRETKNIVRQDMLHLLMQAKKGSLQHENLNEGKNVEFATVEELNLGVKTVENKWDDDHIVGQAILFFLAGFETVAITLSFLALELAINQDVQRKLQTEIDEVNEKSSGKLSYENLQKMKYMDMVISELLRKWPPAIAIDRKCIKKYTLAPNKPGLKPYTVNVNELVIIPIYSIHHDPKYYEDPEKFNPERFSDENKSSILQFTYLPFGIGPRNCIGSRFALMELKSLVFHLLAKFDLVETEKTPNPIILDQTNSFNLIPVGGAFNVGLKLRN